MLFKKLLGEILSDYLIKFFNNFNYYKKNNKIVPLNKNNNNYSIQRRKKYFLNYL